MKQGEPLRRQDKIIVTILFVLILGYVVKGFIIPSDAVSLIGADRGGRQVFANSLNDLVPESYRHILKFKTEIEDTNFLERLLWRKPLHTTLRVKYYYQKNEDEKLMEMKQALGEGPRVFWYQFLGVLDQRISRAKRMYISKRTVVDGDEWSKLLKEANIQSMKDLLRIYGFERVQYYEDEKIIHEERLEPKLTFHAAPFSE